MLLICTFVLLYALALIKADYNNKVVFTGDEWDYQSIAVNNYYGSEFLTTGRIKEIETYKLEKLDDGKIQFWENFSGNKAYHRGPFYPAFLCLSYKVFGINPIVVKYFQLFLIVFSGLLLVFIGKLAWGEKGQYIGYLSSIVFVTLNYRFSEHLMPENWQFLFLALITILLFYHYRGSGMHSILLGIMLGFSLLNKGTTFFLFPIIILIDMFYVSYKNKSHWWNMLLFVISFVFIAGLWSMYVSVERNQFTFISAQAGEVLLEGNNEFCSDGLWHPEWRDKPYSSYNTDKMGSLPSVIRVVNFYLDNPRYLSNFPAKVKTAFAPIYSFIALISLYLILLSFWISSKSKFITSIVNKWFGFVIAFLLLCFSIFFSLFSATLNTMMFFSIVALMFFLSILFYKELLKIPIIIPFQFVVIFLNFLIFTLAFYVCNETYLSRYVKTMDGIFILVCFYLLFEILDNLFKIKSTINEKADSSVKRKNSIY